MSQGKSGGSATGATGATGGSSNDLMSFLFGSNWNGGSTQHTTNPIAPTTPHQSTGTGIAQSIAQGLGGMSGGTQPQMPQMGQMPTMRPITTQAPQAPSWMQQPQQQPQQPVMTQRVGMPAHSNAPPGMRLPQQSSSGGSSGNQYGQPTDQSGNPTDQSNYADYSNGELAGPTNAELGYDPLAGTIAQPSPTDYTGGQDTGNWFDTTPVAPIYDYSQPTYDYSQPTFDTSSWDSGGGGFDFGGGDFGGDW